MPGEFFDRFAYHTSEWVTLKLGADEAKQQIVNSLGSLISFMTRGFVLVMIQIPVACIY